jgi:hypothetical protein
MLADKCALGTTFALPSAGWRRMAGPIAQGLSLLRRRLAALRSFFSKNAGTRGAAWAEEVQPNLTN